MEGRARRETQVRSERWREKEKCERYERDGRGVCVCVSARAHVCASLCSLCKAYGH